MTNQIQEHSINDIAEAIRHSYTGEIYDDTLKTKELFESFGFYALKKEVIWKQ